MTERRGEHGHIELTLPQVVDQVVGAHLRNREFDVRMVFAEVVDELRHEIWSNRRNDPQMQRPGECFHLRADHFADFEEFVERGFRLPDDPSADLGGFDGMAVAVEQTHIQLLLELLDHGAERRLCDAALLGGPDKMTMAVQGDDILHLLDGHGAIDFMNTKISK